VHRDVSGADRSGRTRHERHHRAFGFNISFGLVMNAALVAMIAKDLGRQLAAGVAIDAGGINEEIPRHIFRYTLLQACHDEIA
jgi:hypothetical protein